MAVLWLKTLPLVRPDSISYVHLLLRLLLPLLLPLPLLPN
jgi:hypothetical protein